MGRTRTSIPFRHRNARSTCSRPLYWRTASAAVASFVSARSVATVTISLPQAVRRELDRVAKEDGVSRSDVLRQSLEDFLFVRRFRRLRQRMMAAAQAEGIYTDEDVFTRVWCNSSLT